MAGYRGRDESGSCGFSGNKLPQRGTGKGQGYIGRQATVLRRSPARRAERTKAIGTYASVRARTGRSGPSSIRFFMPPKPHFYNLDRLQSSHRPLPVERRGHSWPRNTRRTTFTASGVAHRSTSARIQPWSAAVLSPIIHLASNRGQLLSCFPNAIDMLYDR